jgi:hypothetical protein
MITLDNPQDTSIIEFDLDTLENVVITDEDVEINELASMLASIGMDDEIDENELVLDMLYAEHEEMMRAANSYDEDAISYGEMV